MPSRSRAAGSQLAIHAPAPQKTRTMMANTRSRLTARRPEGIDRHRELIEETGVDLLDDLDERRKRPRGSADGRPRDPDHGAGSCTRSVAPGGWFACGPRPAAGSPAGCGREIFVAARLVTGGRLIGAA